MSEKISIQQIADALSQRLTYPKKLTDAFVHSLTDSIVEGLQSDGLVKVKGLGTFKVVEVESRESVNVSDGKRIIIPSFKKLSFVPDDAVNDRLVAVANEMPENLQATTESPIDEPVDTPIEEPAETSIEVPVETSVETPVEIPVETPAVNADTKPSDAEPFSQEDEPKVNVVETEIQLNESEIQKSVESEVKPSQPSDDFSKIDNIIATPEIVDEALSRLENIRDRRSQLQSELETYRMQAEEARNNVEIAMEKVNEAEESVRRAEDSLQQARQNLTGAEAEKVEKENLAEQTSKSLDEVGEEILSVESEIERLMNEETTPLENDSRNIDNTQEAINVDDDKAAFNFGGDLSVEDTKIQHADNDGKHKVSAKWTVALIFLLLLFVGVGFLPRLLNKQTVNVKEEKTEQVEQKDTLTTKEEVEPEVKVMPIDSMNTTTENAEQPAAEKEKVEEQVEEKAEEKKEEEVKEEPQRPKTYVIKKGETLTRIAVRFYGSKDAVRKIINANNFANPDNIAVGTTINLP